MLTDELLLAQAARYPDLRCLDCLKALYQAEFGCGHLLTNPQGAQSYLRREWDATGADASADLVEPLGNRFARVHLCAAKSAGMNPDTLFRLFHRATSIQTGDAARFAVYIGRIIALCEQGELPFTAQEAADTLRDYRAAGCPATSHSEAFRQAYHPAYRVIDADTARLLPLFIRIDKLLRERGRILIAIDGPAASGKSTLARLLQDVYGAAVVPMDDFFLQPHQRNPERFAMPGGNVDHERVLTEVLTPWTAGQPVTYRPFDCGKWALGEEITVQDAPLTIVEGSYSMHPELVSRYDLTVLTAIAPQEQLRRIRIRNGEAMLARFRDEWIPLENAYFAATDIERRADLRLSNS